MDCSTSQRFTCFISTGDSLIYIKEYSTPQGVVVAMCDEELLGKLFVDGEKHLDLEKYSNFYKGELIDEKDAGERIRGNELYSANIVGKRAVEVVIKGGLAGEGDIDTISEVPYVHIYKIVG